MPHAFDYRLRLTRPVSRVGSSLSFARKAPSKKSGRLPSPEKRLTIVHMPRWAGPECQQQVMAVAHLVDVTSH